MIFFFWGSSKLKLTEITSGENLKEDGEKTRDGWERQRGREKCCKMGLCAFKRKSQSHIVLFLKRKSEGSAEALPWKSWINIRLLFCAYITRRHYLMEEDSSPSDTWKGSEITHQTMQPRGSKMDRWEREGAEDIMAPHDNHLSKLQSALCSWQKINQIIYACYKNHLQWEEFRTALHLGPQPFLHSSTLLCHQCSVLIISACVDSAATLRSSCHFRAAI